MTLRLQVRELRLARRWTQEELAKRASVRRATVNSLENRPVKSVDLDVLERLAEALGVDHPGYLLVREKAERRPAGRK